MNEEIGLVFRQDDNTCAISSFACAIYYLLKDMTLKKHRQMFQLVASHVNKLAVEVGGGLFDFMNEIVKRFGNFPKLWMFHKKHKMKCILECESFQSRAVGKRLFLCCLQTSRGSSDHMVTVRNGYIFDNNYPFAIPLNQGNLDLCSSLGSDSLTYQTCEFIVEWVVNWREN